MRRRTDPGLLLLLTPVLWGATFPAAKLVLRHMPPFAFMAWTRTLGFLGILALAPLARSAAAPRARSRWRGRGVGRIPGPRRATSWHRALGPSVLLGALIFAAYLLQTEGLARTTATNAGFITGLYVVFTPVLAAALLGHHVPARAWVAVVVSLGGMALLSIRELRSIHLYAGDLLVLAGAAVWALHVLAIGHYSPRFHPWTLSLGQMAATAAMQLVAAAPGGLRTHAALSLHVWPLLILTGVLGSGVAYTLQIVGQRTISPTRAVVVLAGEALFAALFSAVWIGERLSLHQWGGAAMVLAAMAYSELSARRAPVERLEAAAAP